MVEKENLISMTARRKNQTAVQIAVRFQGQACECNLVGVVDLRQNFDGIVKAAVKDVVHRFLEFDEHLGDDFVDDCSRHVGVCQQIV